MWFKNLQIYRLPINYAMTPDALAAFLKPQAFTACTSLDMQSQGWLAPRDGGDLVHTVSRQMLLKLGTEKKLLPASVINQVTKLRCTEIEEQQGFKPGRKQMKEIKEQVADELLPRAFSIFTSTSVWIDPVNGWLVIDTGSPSKADEVLKLLLKSIDKFPVQTLNLLHSPIAAMTDWLAADEAPAGFTVDQDTELRSTGESKATVRYVRHTLEAEDVQRHIVGGKQCTRLAMTWMDKISFVLTESLAIKRIAALDVLKEASGSESKDDAERFDGDFMLMTAEFNRLLSDLVESLGGENIYQRDFVQEQAQVENDSDDNDDALYGQAVQIVVSQQRASISLVQRHLRIGYNRAARLLEAMETAGVVSEMQSNGTRDILKVA